MCAALFGLIAVCSTIVLLVSAGVVEPDCRVAAECGYDRERRSVSVGHRPRRPLDQLSDQRVADAGPVQ